MKRNPSRDVVVFRSRSEAILKPKVRKYVQKIANKVEQNVAKQIRRQKQLFETSKPPKKAQELEQNPSRDVFVFRSRFEPILMSKTQKQAYKSKKKVVEIVAKQIRRQKQLLQTSKPQKNHKN